MKKVGILTLMILVYFTATVLAQAPQLLNFQARLNDSSGQPVADGNYSIRFSIYPVASGGTAVWSQTQTVTTKDGVFNVLLSNVALDLSASEYYLAMKVGSDAEMSPRQRIASVPYALNANTWMQSGDNIYCNISGNVGIGTSEPAQILTLGKGNILLPDGYLGEQGNLYFGGITDQGEIGLRLWGGEANGGQHTGGYIDVKTDSPDEGLVFRVDNDDGDSNRMKISADGKVNIYATLYVSGADLAEPFDMTDIESLELGDVVVIDPQNPLHVKKSSRPYDSTVAGIVSSNEQAGYVAGGRSDGSSDKPVALVGRVLCKVSTENGPIQIGDLLTTAATPGHAMKATDFERRQGAILGKALQAFDGDTGTIMVLVTLQ